MLAYCLTTIFGSYDGAQMLPHTPLTRYILTVFTAITIFLFGFSTTYAQSGFGGGLSQEEARSALASALASYKRGDFLLASINLYSIISEKESATNVEEEQAEYTLGKTFYRLNLYQAALEFFIRIAKAGPQHRYFRTTCKWLYYLSRKIPGDDELLKRIATYKPQDCIKVESEISYLRGQYHYKRGELADAIGYLSQVSRDNVLYLKATFLKAVAQARLDDGEDTNELKNVQKAIATLAQILRYTVDSYNGYDPSSRAGKKPSVVQSDNGKLSTARLIDVVAQGDYKRDLKYFSQLSVLTMARLFYELNKNLKAVRYYNYIPINGFFWLEALFESSWALFRMGPKYHEKALGNLHSLSSPFFTDEYLPEMPILKAVILYSRCDFDKASEALNEFRVVYEPLFNELEGYTSDFSDPKQLYEFLRRIQKDPSSSARVGQILNALFEDRELKRINAHITEMERELNVIQKAQVDWSRSALANYVIQTIEFTRDIAFDRAGELAKNRLDRVVAELKDLRGKADSIDIEIATSERSDTELSLSGVEMQRQLLEDAKRRTPDAEHLYWPFNGEYWRDELGYYLYRIRSKCGR